MPLLLMLLWILLNGRITVEILLFGAGITALVYVFMLRVLNWSLKKDFKMLRTLPLFLIYLLNLVREIAAAAVKVAALALNPEKKTEPKVIEFHSGLEDRGLNVLLANSITLTPGTITVEQEGDRFTVHALRPEYAEGIEESSFIRLLRRFPK